MVEGLVVFEVEIRPCIPSLIRVYGLYKLITNVSEPALYRSTTTVNIQRSRLDAGDTILKKVLSVFRRASRSPRPSLTTLPNHLLIETFKHLKILDQACLALTCKSFHFIFSPVFENEAFRFPRLYQLRVPGLDNFGVVRYQLLQRLQDKRVKYCVKCMKLHRREAFAQPTYHGPMVNREYCWTEAGVVDLCPCVTLTFQDKSRVVRALFRLAKGKSVVLRGGIERAFVPGTRGENPSTTSAPVLIHECQIRDHGFVAAQIKTVLYIRRKSFLIAETEYNVRTDRRVMDWRPNEAFRDAHYNLLWAMRTSEMGLLLDEDGGKERVQTLDVVRNLGSCELPVDGNWVKQDRLMSPSFLRLVHAYGN
ncbi:hypothetical protein BJX76DRAFT_321302 [Aspergillus varians]